MMKNFALAFVLSLVISATSANAQSVPGNYGFGSNLTPSKPVATKHVARSTIPLSTALPTTGMYANGFKLRSASNFNPRFPIGQYSPVAPRPANRNLLTQPTQLPSYLNRPTVSSRSLAQVFITRALYDF